MSVGAWNGLLGEVGPSLWEFASTFADPRLADIPAVVFEDQSKAFERMSHAWIVEVLRRWILPRWLMRGLLDQIIRRAVCACLRGRLGEARLLRRGIGMGGTASILIWNMGCDPVITAVEIATNTRVPSYVDDGAILARGPVQVVAASIVLIIAGHCAGCLLRRIAVVG